MSQVTSFVICFLMAALRSRLSLQLEVAALRHQLSVYRGSQRRPPISSSDRLLWAMIASVWSGWRKALFFVQPRTVLAWQHKRFRDHWHGLSWGLPWSPIDPAGAAAPHSTDVAGQSDLGLAS